MSEKKKEKKKTKESSGVYDGTHTAKQKPSGSIHGREHSRHTLYKTSRADGNPPNGPDLFSLEFLSLSFVDVENICFIAKT